MNEAKEGELPKGWKWARLGEVIGETQSGFASGKRDPGGTVQLRMNNVDGRGMLDWSILTRVPATDDQIRKYSLVPDDVMFNNTNSTELVGKSALFTGCPEPIVYSNHFTRLRTDAQHLLPAYLALWLRMTWERRIFEKICNRWIGQSAVKPQALLALRIPLPPLSEQRRIAGLLNEQMAAVERARAAAERKVEEARALAPAFLRAAFDGPQARKWPKARLGEVCEMNPRRPRMSRDPGALTSFVPMQAVGMEGGGITALEARPYAGICKGYTYFADGDVLFAKITPCMQNGKHAIAEGLLDGLGFGSTEFHVVRPTYKVTSEWVFRFITQPWVLKDAEKHFSGSVGQQRVPAAFLADLSLPLPPLSDQRRIAGLLNEQMAAVERARAAAEREIMAISRLPQILLREAFAGRV